MTEAMTLDDVRSKFVNDFPVMSLKVKPVIVTKVSRSEIEVS